MTNSGMTDFVRAYLACGLEVGSLDPEEPGWSVLAGLSTYDLPQETVDKASRDCLSFIRQAQELGKGDYLTGAVEGYSEDQAAYDFWLTRNGHGAGYWDRGLGPDGDTLTELCGAFPETDFYLGDDGKAYLS